MSERGSRQRLSVRALGLYVLAWAIVAAGIVALATALVDDGEEQVALPPIEATQLTAAASEAGCVLRRGRAGASGLQVDGPRGTPAAPAIYDAPGPAAGALVAALRRGTIVIDYRPDVPEDAIDALVSLHRAVPRGTIVAPNPDMEFSVAARTWRRLLACPRLDSPTLDALRLFRGRFIGSGPDSPR